MTRPQKAMLHGGLTLAAIGLAAFLIADGGGGGSEPEFPARDVVPVDPAKAGSVAGVVLFEGRVPENPPLDMDPNCRAATQGAQVCDPILLVEGGRVRGAVVYVRSGVDPKRFDWDRTELVVGNAGCLYVPRVSVAMSRRPIRFVNQDRLEHNIHVYGEGGSTPFNRSIRGGESFVRQLENAGLYKLRCDIHPWMAGSLRILEHPLGAVTDAGGAFELSGIPEGEIELAVWHEALKGEPVKVRIEAGKRAEAELRLAE